MVGHKICFYGEILLIIPKLYLLPLLIWSTAWVFQNTLQRRYNAGDESHKIEPRYK